MTPYELLNLSKWHIAIWSLAMTGHENGFEPLDHRTCQSICDAIGERLRESLRQDNAALSNRLRQLLEELRERDADGSAPH